MGHVSRTPEQRKLAQTIANELAKSKPAPSTERKKMFKDHPGRIVGRYYVIGKFQSTLAPALLGRKALDLTFPLDPLSNITPAVARPRAAAGFVFH
jgi:hypothetical protein